MGEIYEVRLRLIAFAVGLGPADRGLVRSLGAARLQALDWRTPGARSASELAAYVGFGVPLR